MADSSNGKVEETREFESANDQLRKDVVVENVGDSSKLVELESVKVLEINDENSNSEPAGKRDVTVTEEIIESAEKLLDGDDSSSSSSSSDDQEEQAEAPDEESREQVEEKEAPVFDNEEKYEIDYGSSLIETEKAFEETTKLLSSYENKDSPDEAATAELSNLTSVEEAFKGIIKENSTGESSSQAVYEAASGSVENSSGIPENTEKSPVVSVNRDSLQPSSWKNCCGLFEVLRQSDR